MDNPDSKKAYRLRIHGRVQGVGFRYWARNQALRNGVTGWVKNEPSGTVLIECEGGETRVDTFLAALRQGPPGAFVQKADLVEHPPKGAFRDFTIEF